MVYPQMVSDGQANPNCRTPSAVSAAFASLTTVHADGRIESRIISEWAEDSTGCPITPWSINWMERHKETPRPKSGKTLRVVR
jgi:hypothetical protein